MEINTRTVGILMFDEVEVLDFAGPFEIFSVAGRRSGGTPFKVVLIAQEIRLTTARNGLAVMPQFTLETAPELDILIVPGGLGTRALMNNESVIGWIRTRAASTPLVLSVCTGALLLAKAGLLSAKSATTHHLAYEELRTTDPAVRVVEGVRVVDEGSVVTSAGIAAGIDMSLAMVGRLLGIEAARETADFIEYPWAGASNVGRPATHGS